MSLEKTCSSSAAGMMFLFPHVLQVVTAAESCHTTTGCLARVVGQERYRRECTDTLLLDCFPIVPVLDMRSLRTHSLVSAPVQARLQHYHSPFR